MYPALITTRFRCLIRWPALMGASLLFGGCATLSATPLPVAAAAVDLEQPAGEPPPDLSSMSDPEDAGREEKVPAMGPTADDFNQPMENEANSGVRSADRPAPFDVGGVVRPGLYLSVKVMVAGREEISESSRQVAEGGTLDLPLIGNVTVAGLRLIEVDALLTERYRTYLVEPQVVIEFAQPNDSKISPWGYVTVLGRIRDPGKIPIPATHDLTVSAAIQQAGGLIASARDSSIQVTRQEENGTVRRMEVDLKAYAKGQSDEDIVLRAGDVVFVPESAW